MRPSQVGISPNAPEAFSRITAGQDVWVDLHVLDGDGQQVVNYSAFWVLFADDDQDIQVASGHVADDAYLIPSAVTQGLFGTYILRLAITTDDAGLQYDNYLLTVRR